MMREEEKESKKIIHQEGIIGKSIPFSREITSNTSNTSGKIPIFTNGNGNQSGESSSVETESTE